MPQVINTNIASLNAQRNLNESQRDANVAFERLSSGLRINSAKDDAAGLAISTRFQSQISGLNVAQRNASDGISLAQTTEGALSEVINNLQRIRDLAVQSANATNSASDRLALDQEVQQRIEEIARIADQTTFNGLKVLDGSFGEQQFQVGANAGDTIDVNLSKGSRADQIGSLAVSGSRQVGNAPLAEGDLTIAVGDSEAFPIPGTGTDSSARTGTAGLVFTQADGENFTITSQTLSTSTGGSPAIGAQGFGTTGAVGSGATQLGQISIEALEAITIGGTAPENAGFLAGGETIAVTGSLEEVNIKTVDGANDAIKRVDSALTTINGIRSELGAVQNRFESTISNLSTTSENLAAANSRIRDADFAAETAELARTQVLQQAGLSVLSQANARPQQVLQLLQG